LDISPGHGEILLERGEELAAARHVLEHLLAVVTADGDIERVFAMVLGRIGLFVVHEPSA
jgi:hypothetical protein